MDKELQIMQALTKDIFKKHNGIIALNLYIPKTSTVFQLKIKNKKEKDLFKKVFRDYCADKQGDSFLLVSESWMFHVQGV